MPLNYRLSLDLGTNSIGWAMLHLDMNAKPSPSPDAIIRAGVRIFGDGRDPQTGASLAVDRRQARLMRRNRDRTLKRKKRLINALVDEGLFPTDVQERRALTALDPYELRARGLSEQLTRGEFGRAIFHLNQRRGFLSNRKTDGDDGDGSLLKGRIAAVREELSNDGYATVGQWLADRHGQRESVRARLRGTTAKDKAYDLYFDRAMIHEEFDTLWTAQQHFDPEFYSEAKRTLFNEVIFYQRNLRPVRPGRCTFEPELDRAAKALPSSQRFRIYQEVNNLRIVNADFTDTPLTLEQRDLIVAALEKQKTMSFDAMRKTLKLAGGPRFNLEGAKRKLLKGNETSYVMAADGVFGDAWHTFDLETQDEIVTQILDEENEEKLVAWLMEYHGLDSEHAATAAGTRVSLSKLAPGYARLSQRATTTILPHLEAGVVTYNAAVDAAGYGSHSARSYTQLTGEVLDTLPYYGEYLTRHVGHGSGLVTDNDADRFGRIANPTVHIVLNEVRKVVNSLIDDYGPPAQVVIEVVRDLNLSQDRKREIDREQATRQQENDAFKAQIKELTGIDASRDDVQKMRLWIELNPSNTAERRCPYTGEQISITKLFSPEVEIEHILPFARTLDDSMNNKTVAITRANRLKTNQTPFEAFGHSPDGYDYEGILDRARLMPKGKAYRFAADGYQRWLRTDADFLARALTDTAYISKIALEYLQLVAPGNVWAIPGRLTGKLRHHWGLNSLLHESGEKNRFDHRHHAVDAIVIGFTDRNTLQRVATASARSGDMLKGISADGPIAGVTSEDFRRKAMSVVGAIAVSHRPNHGYQRQMNNDTNYGLRAEGYAAVRKRINGFTDVSSIEKATFTDPHLKARLLTFVGSAEGAEFKNRIAAFTSETGIHSARLLDKLDTIPIPIHPEAEYRAPKRSRAREDLAVRGVKGDSNYCIEIYKAANGKWKGEVITTFQAYQVIRDLGHQDGFSRLRNPEMTLSGQPLVMRLMRDDTIQATIDDKTALYRLCVIKGSGALLLSQIHEANVDARVRSKELKYLSKSPGSLQATNAQPVAVSPSGRVTMRRTRL
jgi:CRISPR-associated endonuclease Csn1